MDEGSAALVHHLRLFLRIEVLRNQSNDADELALPILKPWRPFLNQIKQVLLGQPQLSLDLLEPCLRSVGVFFVLSGAGHGAPQIVVSCLGMRSPLLGSAPLLGEVGLGAMGVAVDAVVLERMCGIEHALDRLRPVSLFAFLDIVARETQVIEYPVSIGPLPK